MSLKYQSGQNAVHLSRRSAAILFIMVLLTGILILPACGSAAQQEGASGKSSEQRGQAADESGSDTFVPGSFEWSGGSGKIEMTCPQVRMDGDQAYATIQIDSEHYSWLKVDGTEYPCEHENGTSYAEIPVVLDETMEISGQTTAMSQPHEVTYTICVGSEPASDEASGAAGGASGIAAGKENASENGSDDGDHSGGASSSDAMKTSAGSADIKGLTVDHTMEKDYAECFDVYYYSDGYKLLDIHGDLRYLMIPEGKDLPEGVTPSTADGKPVSDASDAVFGTLESGETLVLLRQPLQKVYMAATAVMAQVNAIDAMDAVRLSGTDADGWYLDAPKEALASGDMVYAGKYSEPDYELLVQEGCDLAVESTMIDHSPEVKEKLEELGIPVLTDHSSYEDHPLGRAEWVRFYGALFDREAASDEQFEKQQNAVSELEGQENTDKTVCFFYIGQDGTAVVRSAEDYIPRMIEIAGGQYIFSDLEAAAGNSAAVNLSMEEFYATASDADYLIYNASIDAPLSSLQDLLAKSDLFNEFKAVQEGQVWTTDKNLYQATDSIGDFIGDLHNMLTDGNPDDMIFLKPVK